MFHKRLNVAIIAACFFIPSSGWSAQSLITYTGLITSGTDYTGVFTSPNHDLTGLSYSETFTVDTGVGAAYSDNGLVSKISGVDDTDPIKAVLTINGVTYYFGTYPHNEGSAQNVNTFNSMSPGLYDEVSTTVQDFDPNSDYFQGTFQTITSFDNNIINTSSLTSPLFYRVQPSDRPTGSVNILTGSGDRQKFLLASLIPQTVRIEGVTAVPEPASWALFLVGIIAVGRWRRRGSVTI